jgi:hypothetical protein
MQRQLCEDAAWFNMKNIGRSPRRWNRPGDERKLKKEGGRTPRKLWNLGIQPQ